MTNTCPNHPGKYAPCRDGNGGYICRACWMREVRQRQRERRNGKPGLGRCLCGDSAVAVLKTPNGKVKLCAAHLEMEKRQAAEMVNQ